MSEKNKKLNIDEVKKIAKLARLELSEKEVEKFSTQLSSILEYIDQLQEVDTDNIESVFQVGGLDNMTREDFDDQCDIQEDLVACAPERDGMLVKVKNVL